MRNTKQPSRSIGELGRAARGGSGWRRVRLWGLLVLGATVLLSLIVPALSSANGAGSRISQAASLQLRPPSGLLAFGTGDGGVTLSWQPMHPAPVGYHIYRATGRHGPYTIMGSVNAPDMDTYTDSGDLTPGMTYAYTVTAFDRQSESAPVGPIVAVVLISGPTPTTAVPAPLPTFASIAAPTLTAIARLPDKTATPLSGPVEKSGSALTSTVPTVGGTVFTQVPTDSPKGTVGTTPATTTTATRQP